jgi:hypothetical protein
MFQERLPGCFYTAVFQATMKCLSCHSLRDPLNAKHSLFRFKAGLDVL